MRPVLLDLCCGAGGAARGYQDAGFYVVGVDVVAQPRYAGDEFVQADVLDLPPGLLSRADVLHAGPPCQLFSAMSGCRPGLSGTYPNLVGPVRSLMQASNLPYVIENVVGSPLHRPTVLCGQMFGLDLYRHRLFESNVPLAAPPHPPHDVPASRAGHWTPGTIMSVAGHVAPIAEARRAMGIDWMRREELAEAIPPAYARWVGAALMDAVQGRVRR